MQLGRGRLVLLLIVVAVFFGWKHVARSAHETAVLHVPGVNDQDTYATLWVVEDEQNVWIRAESENRLWLAFLRDHPRVELRRDGQTVSYRAKPYDTDDAREYVNPMFREKYGLSDELRAWVPGRETVPIRLDRL